MSVDFSFVGAKGVKQDFSAHYEKYIKPRIDEFEQKRLAALEKSRQRKWWMIIVNVIITLILFFAVFYREKPIDWLKFLPAFYLLSYLFVQWSISQYKAGIKEAIYPLIFKFFGDDFTYKSKPSLDISDEIKASGIIPRYDTAELEDYVSGSYEGVKLQLIEAALLRRSGKSQTVIFRGLFVSFSVNKNFSSKTVIKSESGAIGNWLKGAFSTLQPVKLEDPNFEKIFEVYSNNQVEARYLLTTSFMERLVSLKDLFKVRAGGFQGSFYDNHLLLSIPCADKFRVGSIEKPVSFTEEIQTILKEMQLIFQIIDILKLNQRTGV